MVCGMNVFRVIALVAVLGGGAAADKAEKEQRDEISQADAEKFQGFFNKFVDAVVQNKDACPKMATAINSVIDGNVDIIKKANEAKKAKKKLPKAVEEKMMARVKEMMPAMQKCGSDKAVQDAIARLDHPDEKPGK
jgi:hypothetical protein